MFDSSNVSRDNVSREIGRIMIQSIVILGVDGSRGMRVIRALQAQTWHVRGSHTFGAA